MFCTLVLNDNFCLPCIEIHRVTPDIEAHVYVPVRKACLMVLITLDLLHAGHLPPGCRLELPRAFEYLSSHNCQSYVRSISLSKHRPKGMFRTLT
jgi:hypothetical protein